MLLACAQFSATDYNDVAKWALENKKRIAGSLFALYVGSKVFRYALGHRRHQILLRRGELKRKEFAEKVHKSLAVEISPDPKLLDMSAVEVRARIISGDYTCEQVILTFIQKAYECHKKYNCLLEEHYDQAWAMATELDRVLKEKKKEGKEPFNKFVESKPLLGVPLSIKDCYIMKDSDCTGGMLYKCGDLKPWDGEMVSLLRQAGGVPFVKTSIPQCYMLPETWNHIIGHTLNPHNTRRTPGGSSGGDAALVAAKGAPIAIGGDIGGSLRGPANFSGIMGHKSSSKRMMGRGKENIDGTTGWPKPTIKSVTGPLCRCVDDLVTMMKVLWSPEALEMDPHLAPIPFREEIYQSNRKLKVAYLINDGYMTPVAAVQRAVKETIQHVKDDLEYEVVNLEDILARRPEIFEPYASLGHFAITKYMQYQSAVGNMRDYTDALHGEHLLEGFREAYAGATLPNVLRPLLAKVFSWLGEKRKASIVLSTREGGFSVKEERDLTCQIDEFRYQFWQMMNEEHIDLIISPVCAFPAMPLGFSKDFLSSLSHQLLQNLLDSVSCAFGPVTFVQEDETHYDVESLPTYEQDRVARLLSSHMKGAQGLPVGVQVWGKPFDDELVLRLCKELEKVVNKK